MNEFEQYDKQDKPLWDIIHSEYKQIEAYSVNYNIIDDDQAKCWVDSLNNYHREDDLPARIFEGNNSDCGFMEWYQHGKLHRENDKPALIWDYGCEWWINGVRHRENGPAIFNSTDYNTGKNDKKWFLDGIEYSEDEFNAIQEKKQLETTVDINLKHSNKIKL